MRLAALGLSYARVGEMLGFAKSTLCKWLKQEKMRRVEMRGEVLEMDGVWMRMRGGKAEMKVVRDETGAALGTFGSWEDALDDVYDSGVVSPAHIVSDGDRAIESAIGLVYGGKDRHQLCQFHLLREYRRNIGGAGFAEARALLDADSLPQARELAESIMSLTGGRAAYWCAKALKQGLVHLGNRIWQIQDDIQAGALSSGVEASRADGHRMWTMHNLLVLLQIRGLLHSTT